MWKIHDQACKFQPLLAPNNAILWQQPIRRYKVTGLSDKNCGVSGCTHRNKLTMHHAWA